MQNSNKIQMLTIKEAGKLIEGLTEFRIRALCLSGELPCLKAGKKFLINSQVLYSYVNGELNNIVVNPPCENKSQIKRIDL